MNFAVVVPCWTHSEISRHSPAVGVVSQKWHDKAGPWGQTKPSTKGYRGGSPTAVQA